MAPSVVLPAGVFSAMAVLLLALFVVFA
jgi:hypothetical protein